MSYYIQSPFSPNSSSLSRVSADQLRSGSGLVGRAARGASRFGNRARETCCAASTTRGAVFSKGVRTSPTREILATAPSGAADGRGDTGEVGETLAPFERQSVTSTDPVQFLVEDVGLADGAVGEAVDAGAEAGVDLLGFEQGEHGFAQGGGVGGGAAADAGGHGGGEAAADLVQVVHVGTVEHGQMDHRTGPEVEVVQQGRCGFPDLAVASVGATEAEGAGPQAVSEGGVLEPSQPDELVEDAVRGRSGQVGAACDVLEGESGEGADELVQDQGHPFDHRRRELLAFLGRRFGRGLGHGHGTLQAPKLK